jgi:outer membrane protein assembly factor BamB
MAGFADVVTAPITMLTSKVVVPVAGEFALGAGPVISRNGGIGYLASQDGRVTAIRANGSVEWTIRLPAGVTEPTAPLVGADGTLYLAGLAEHRAPGGVFVGPAIADSALVALAPDGRVRWYRRLLAPAAHYHFRVVSPPNAVGARGAETILLAAVLRNSLTNSFEVELMGFDATNGRRRFASPAGGQLSEPITGHGPCVGMHCVFGVPRTPPTLPVGLSLPRELRPTSIGVVVAPGDVAILSDGWRSLRGFALTSTGPISTFQKVDRRRLTGAPIALPTGRSLYAVTDARIAFAGPGAQAPADLWHHVGASDWQVEVPAARMASGIVTSISRNGAVTFIENVTPVRRHQLQAETVAPPSASRSFVYVSVRRRLVSFDAATLDQVNEMPLEVGGLHAPAIGPDGRVWLLDNGKLYIFRASTSARRKQTPPGKNRPQVQRSDL